MEKDDLIFIPPLLLHSVSRGQSALYQSETYVFHMNFLGGNATDICSTRYLMPLTNEELSVPCLIRPTHPAYVSLRKIFAQISSLFANPVEGLVLLHDQKYQKSAKRAFPSLCELTPRARVIRASRAWQVRAAKG